MIAYVGAAGREVKFSVQWGRVDDCLNSSLSKSSILPYRTSTSSTIRCSFGRFRPPPEERKGVEDCRLNRPQICVPTGSIHDGMEIPAKRYRMATDGDPKIRPFRFFRP